MPLPLDPQQIDTITARLVAALGQLVLDYTRQDGSQQRVRLSRRLITASGSLLL